MLPDEHFKEGTVEQWGLDAGRQPLWPGTRQGGRAAGSTTAASELSWRRHAQEHIPTVEVHLCLAARGRLHMYEECFLTGDGSLLEMRFRLKFIVGRSPPTAAADGGTQPQRMLAEIFAWLC